jgi:hypothetical protein
VSAFEEVNPIVEIAGFFHHSFDFARLPSAIEVMNALIKFRSQRAIISTLTTYLNTFFDMENPPNEASTSWTPNF